MRFYVNVPGSEVILYSTIFPSHGKYDWVDFVGGAITEFRNFNFFIGFYEKLKENAEW